jgi:hypothetical protein
MVQDIDAKDLPCNKLLLGYTDDILPDGSLFFSGKYCQG